MYCSCRGLANLSFNLLGHSSITCLSVFVHYFAIHVYIHTGGHNIVFMHFWDKKRKEYATIHNVSSLNV